uniref:Stress response protein nst1-like n=1 Tax=Actinia tenebrosa TaxID=6105 RepID=A0A6P8I8Q4_ACTTE
MCGTFQSKFKRNNKVAPVPCPFELEVLRRAKIQIEKEKALLQKEIAIQTGSSLLFLDTENRGCETPACVAYDLNLDGNIVQKGLKASCPRRLARDPKLPVLTREMLLEKQAQAEENRNKQLEKIRKAAALKSLQAREKKLAEEEEKLNKIAKINEKLAKADENRQAQLEGVKTKAKKSSNNTRSKIAEAQNFAKAQQTLVQSDRKLKEAQTKREKAVSKVVRKQRQREAQAQKVRERAAKQMQEEEDCVRVFDLEVDSHFYASDSESDKDDMWDAAFWDRKV